MKKKFIYLAISCLLALVSACSGNSNSSGESLLEDQDRIVVGVDTFSTFSGTLDVTLTPDSFPIYTTPDSFLLGECDGRFGTVRAEILAQFACPEGFRYPAGAEVDSVCLFFNYTSWYGDGHSPMSIDIYPLKTVLQYTEPYSHNLDIDEFVDPSAPSVLKRQRILIAQEPTDSVYNSSTRTYVPYVRCRLTDDFAKDFFLNRDFSSQQAFNEAFKGLYIKSNFGGSTLLHVTDINLSVYYHYTYQKAGRDTTVNDLKSFYANSEVRQVNRYQYFTDTDTEDELHNRQAMLADSTRNFIVAPANLYARVSLPIRDMANTILNNMRYPHVTPAGVDTLVRRPYISKAAISLEVLNYVETPSKDRNREDWAAPANNMLLIKESSLRRFFMKNELPSDTCAILSSITKTNITNDSVGYFYTYDLSQMLTDVIRKIEADTAEVEETLDMLLVPVSVSRTESSSGSSYYYGNSSSSAAITGVKQEQIVSATIIRSAVDPEKPLSLEVVYSGF